MHRSLMIFTVTLALAASAFAQSADPQASAPGERCKISDERWGRPLDPIVDVYPVKAARARRSGEATVTCIVMEKGRLDYCRVVEEKPVGYDFGKATINIANKYKILEAATCEGRSPIGGEVTFTQPFKLQ